MAQTDSQTGSSSDIKHFDATLLPKAKEGQSLKDFSDDVGKAFNDLLSKLNQVAGGSSSSISIAIPIGGVIEFSGPATTALGTAIKAPDSFLWCDGKSYLITAYPALFKLIGYTFGGAGYNFNVPDRREAAGVGVGTRASGIIAHDVFTLGQFKDDQLQNHAHSWPYHVYTATGLNPGGYYSIDTAGNTNTGGMIADGGNGTPRGGLVTRGKRIGMNYLIRSQ